MKKNKKFTTTKVVRSNMTSQISLGKNSNKRKAHGNSNGKSSSHKMREVQKHRCKKRVQKRNTQNILFLKKYHSIQDINHASPRTMIP